ncbi:MAG: PDZ domain-containing protein [Rhodopirellula sp.]|nr:PDZ domain-containing protein [Rhodopirellula sp.]
MEDSPLSHEPPRPPAEPVLAEPVLRRDRQASPHLPFMLVLLALLLGLLISPYIAEKIVYGVNRGRERARTEVARAALADMPDSASRYTIVAQAIAPSVVGIDTVRIVQSRDEMAFLFRQPRLEAQGEGSGVIIDEAGYIITNFHVIDGASEASVKLSDGRVIRDVQVVGADPPTDIAVLKIEASGLTAAPWGDSDELQVGAPVLAVGNPFGLERTVTAGIISAKDRRGVVGNVGYQDFLQTDAAVNPGNSGGPLVNMSGEVVGINTAIYGRAYQGISFAIPSRMARDVYDQLKATGKITQRGWLGIEMTPVTPQLAEQLNLNTIEGGLVAAVIEGSPAERAGIKPGDLIVRWNADPINEPGDLSLAVARTKPNTKAEVTVLRDGKEEKLTVEVGSRPLEIQLQR